jgi:hypothetical protein
VNGFLASPDAVHPGVGDHLAGGHRHAVQVVLAPVAEKRGIVQQESLLCWAYQLEDRVGKDEASQKASIHRLVLFHAKGIVSRDWDGLWVVLIYRAELGYASLIVFNTTVAALFFTWPSTFFRVMHLGCDLVWYWALLSQMCHSVVVNLLANLLQKIRGYWQPSGKFFIGCSWHWEPSGKVLRGYWKLLQIVHVCQMVPIGNTLWYFHAEDFLHRVAGRRY